MYRAASLAATNLATGPKASAAQRLWMLRGRVSARSVPVKDRYQDNADEKSINSWRGAHEENAAGSGALRRVSKEKQDL